MSMDLRGRILMDTSSADTALDKIAASTKKTADAMVNQFDRASTFIKRSIGLVGVGTLFGQAVESASQLQRAQAVQATILSNQGVAAKYNLSMTQQQYETQRKAGNFSLDFYSKMLDSQAMYLSTQTGINRAEITRAQTLSLTNNDIAKLVSSGPLISGALGAVGAPLHGIHQNFELFLQDAANLSATMGGGGGGSIASSARMMTRILADPARRMSAMTRYGFTLSQSEQMRIKTLETTNGLYAAQEATLQAINNHVQNAARNSASPIELLKNDFSIIEQTLGKGLLPFFDSLANTIGQLVQSMQPLLEQLGSSAGMVLSQLGTALGKVLTDFQPVIDLFLNSLLPAVLGIMQPLLTLATDILDPISKAFTKIVGSGSGMKTLSGIFATMASGISNGLMIGVNAIGKMMSDMSKNGQLDALMQSFVQVFAALEPILPNLATAFGNLIAAIAPLLVAMGPAFVKIMQVWAGLLVALSPAIVIIVDAIAKLVGWISGNKGLTQAIALLAAVWFTKSLFLAPITAALEGVRKMVGLVSSLGGGLKTAGSLIGSMGSGRGEGFVNRYKVAKSELGNEATLREKLAGAHELKMNTLRERLARNLEGRGMARAQARERKLAQYRADLERGAREAYSKKQIEHLSKLSRTERLAKRFGPDLEELGKVGAKRGIFKRLLGLGGGVLDMAANMPAKNQLDATNNLVMALNNLTNAIQNGGLGSKGNSLENKLENKLKSKVESKIKSEVEKKAEGRLASFLEKKGMGRLGNIASKFGKFGRFGSMAAEGAEGAEAAGAVAGGEAAAEGGILAAGAASGAATLGIGLAVAGVTVAYMKWHKQINHAIGTAGKAIWHGAEAVGRWEVRTTKNIAHHIVNGAKAVAHFGANLAKNAVAGAVSLAKGVGHLASGVAHGIGSVIGGLFGGLFGGGSKHENHPLNAMKGMTFTAGALNVHIVSANKGNPSLSGIHGGAGALAAMRDVELRRGINPSARGNVVIERGAFQLNVHGSLDHATMKQVKAHVTEQFTELQRNLKAVGR
jgi:hypothetical protein